LGDRKGCAEFRADRLHGHCLSDHLRFSSDLSVFGLAPDVWVMTVRGRPVGVVEVKKPGCGILDDPIVAGQMYDCLKRLRTFDGLKHVFGIATTYEAWRLFWLRDEATEAAAVATPPATLTDDPAPWHEAWWQRDLGVPVWHSKGAMSVSDEPDAPPAPVGGRVVCAGPVAGVADHTRVIEMAASVLYKMLRPPVEPPTLAGLQRHYLCLTKDSTKWAQLNDTFQRKPGALPSATVTNLLLLADLRGGVEGRLWLAASTRGAVCVLKFAKDRRREARLEHERDM
jgi:hypothetical protein